jgi:siroheme synthase-like protein
LCVVIGTAGDREVIEKTAALEEAGADVRRIHDAAALRDDDVRDAFFVISTPQDAALSARLRALADEHRFLLCCIDQPAFGSVALASIVKAGPVRVAISTAGFAPRVGKLLKEALQRAMDATFARFIEEVAARREAMKAAHPGADDLPLRRNEAIKTAAGFTAKIEFTYPQWFEDDA